MIADMIINTKLNPVVTELFIRGRKLNISLGLLQNLIFLNQKNVRLNSTHYFVLKIPNKQELDFKDFKNLYKKFIAKPYYFLVIDAIIVSDNPSRFRKNP